MIIKQNLLSNSLRANLLRHKAIHRRYQSRCQILRSQLGFEKVESSCPSACQGCSRYHGKAYGQTQSNRTRLICAIHPYGWLSELPCPDWEAIKE